MMLRNDSTNEYGVPMGIRVRCQVLEAKYIE
jgi:hypothetical protein